MPLPTLPGRQTALVVALWDVGANALLGQFKTLKHNVDMTTQDAKGLPDRYEKNQAVKRSRKFSINILRNATLGAPRASALNLTVWDVGGSSRLGDIKDLTLTGSTKWQEGSACKDLDKYPVAVGTGFEVTASEFVSENADLLYLASQTTSLSDYNVTVHVTIADIQFAMPMLLSAASLSIERDGVQMQDVTLKLRGTPTITLLHTVAFDLMYLLGVGAATTTYSIDTATGTEVGYCLIEKGTISVRDSEIVDDQYDFLSQGLSAAS
jgi:hypothetical protein